MGVAQGLVPGARACMRRSRPPAWPAATALKVKVLGRGGGGRPAYSHVQVIAHSVEPPVGAGVGVARRARGRFGVTPILPPSVAEVLVNPQAIWPLASRYHSGCVKQSSPLSPRWQPLTTEASRGPSWRRSTRIREWACGDRGRGETLSGLVGWRALGTAAAARTGAAMTPSCRGQRGRGPAARPVVSTLHARQLERRGPTPQPPLARRDPTASSCCPPRQRRPGTRGGTALSTWSCGWQACGGGVGDARRGQACTKAPGLVQGAHRYPLKQEAGGRGQARRRRPAPIVTGAPGLT
jgi:hypothetical protein